MLRPGESRVLAQRTASSVIHVVEGVGESDIDGTSIKWETHDITALPTHAKAQIRNTSSEKPAFLFVVDDAPLQRKLRFYREINPGE